jgi:FMN-dependent NADH-azoreductase
MNILHVDSSPLGDRSVSRQLSGRIVAGLLQRFPGAVVIRRDVATDPPVHATADIIDIVRFKKDEDLSADQIREKALADTLIGEMEAADVIVIGSPMFNFTVSTQLKAWIDRVCQSGRTFKYTPDGPVGFLGGRRAIVAASRGGLYSAGKFAHRDFQVPYLREILAFMGITDVSFVTAERVNVSQEERARAIAEAESVIEGIIDRLKETLEASQTLEFAKH